jgi:SnoaL-like protein
MSRSLLIPITMMLLIGTATAMLASAMLLPRSDAAPFPIASGADVVRRFYAVVNETIATGNPAALRHVVAPAFVDEPPLPGVTPGRAGLEAYLATLHATDSSIRLEAEVIISSADQVMTRIQVVYRTKNPERGLPGRGAAFYGRHGAGAGGRSGHQSGNGFGHGNHRTDQPRA